MDEYNYDEPLDGQKMLPFSDHWRKHTLSYVEGGSKVCMLFTCFVWTVKP